MVEPSSAIVVDWREGWNPKFSRDPINLLVHALQHRPVFAQAARTVSRNLPTSSRSRLLSPDKD
jgi:hypothetical protein